jgi:hypothetical protein
MPGMSQLWTGSRAAAEEETARSCADSGRQLPLSVLPFHEPAGLAPVLDADKYACLAGCVADCVRADVRLLRGPPLYSGAASSKRAP